MKTSITDDGSNDKQREMIGRMERDFMPAIKSALFTCAERVSVRARGTYLRGPKPNRLRSRIGAGWGSANSRDASGRTNRGGRLERSLIIQGGGYGGLTAGAANRELVLNFVSIGGGRIGLDFGTKVPYGAIWEYGPATRIIRPKTKEYLTFRLETGEWRRVKEVRQSPGRREFLKPALADESPKFGDIMGDFIGKVLEKYGGGTA